MRTGIIKLKRVRTNFLIGNTLGFQKQVSILRVKDMFFIYCYIAGAPLKGGPGTCQFLELPNGTRKIVKICQRSLKTLLILENVKFRNSSIENPNRAPVVKCR